MRSDNKTRGMKLNKLLANPVFIICRLIIFDLVIFALLFYIINSIGSISEFIENGSKQPGEYFGAGNFLPAFSGYSGAQVALIVFATVCLLVCNALDFYKTRISFAEGDINQGQYGTRRWTTRKEIKE